MTLPGPEATHRWQGRTLVDRNGEPMGSIEIIYLDKATDQPEWALLEAGAARPTPTFIPLVSASEEGDTIRVPFDRALIERAPSLPARRELSEDQEEELYRHYGVSYSRAESPSGLPASEPLPAGTPQPAGPPPATSEPDLAAGEPTMAAGEPTMAAGEPVPASESLPAGVGAAGDVLPQASIFEPAPVPVGDVPQATGPAAAPVIRGPGASDGPAARWRVPIADPRFGAAAAATLAVAAAVWRREAIGGQISTAISRLGAIPGTVSRQRRRRRRARTIDQAVSGATRQTTALAWETARLLAGAAVLSVAGAVRGGRRTWAGVQTAQRAVTRGGGRLRPARPGPRRTRQRRRLGMAVAGAAAIRWLGAIPRTSKRRRRQRRRARTINRAVTRVAKQPTALARTMSRLLAGAALLPVARMVRGGRRTRAGVQATQAAMRQRGRGGRLRSSSGRRRRRRGGTVGMAVGGTAGYVLGTRAGEQGYQKIVETARQATERPELKRAGEQAVAKLDQLSGQAADKLQQARQSLGTEAGAGSGGEQRVTAAPATPPEPLP